MNMSQARFLDGFGHAAAELSEMFGAHGQDMTCLAPLDHDGGDANILNCPDPDACYARRIEMARESIRLHKLFFDVPTHPFGEGELAAFESAFGR